MVTILDAIANKLQIDPSIPYFEDEDEEDADDEYDETMEEEEIDPSQFAEEIDQRCTMRMLIDHSGGKRNRQAHTTNSPSRLQTTKKQATTSPQRRETNTVSTSAIPTTADRERGET